MDFHFEPITTLLQTYEIRILNYKRIRFEVKIKAVRISHPNVILTLNLCTNNYVMDVKTITSILHLWNIFLYILQKKIERPFKHNKDIVFTFFLFTNFRSLDILLNQKRKCCVLIFEPNSERNQTSRITSILHLKYVISIENFTFFGYSVSRTNDIFKWTDRSIVCPLCTFSVCPRNIQITNWRCTRYI